MVRSSSDGAAIRYVCTSGFVDIVMFSHSGAMLRHVFIRGRRWNTTSVTVDIAISVYSTIIDKDRKYSL